MKSYQYILCMLAGSLLASCGSNQNKQPVQSMQTTPVIRLREGDLHTSMSIPGVLQPYQAVDLYAKVNGFIKTMTVDIGSQVHKGQLLITLEAPEMLAALKQSQEDIHTKEAIYRGSKATYDRLYRTSRTPGTISPNDLELAHAKMSADSASLLAARSAYQLAGDLKDYLEVRAPFDGVISSRNVYAGAYVTPSDKSSNKPMLTLQQQTKLRLVVDVPEAATAYFTDKDTVHFSVKTLPGKQFAAVVNRKSGSMDQTLRTEQMQMDIINNDRQLLPGMFAQVSLELNNAQKTFIVPQSAVTQNSQRVFVIKVVNNKAQWVDVQKGRETADSLEVYGKLHTSDILVTNATDELKDGAPINIKK